LKINYFEIDASTDMIVATSRNSFINYNRIISSSALPYSVKESKTYRDTSSNSKILYALYVVDQNNVVSLLYDTASFYTELATVNF
jgi:hypothetical protein